MKGINFAVISKNRQKLVINRVNRSKENESRSREHSPIVMVRKLSAAGHLHKKNSLTQQQSAQIQEAGVLRLQTQNSNEKSFQKGLAATHPGSFCQKTEEKESPQKMELNKLTQQVIDGLSKAGFLCEKREKVGMLASNLSFVISFLLQDSLFQDVKARRLLSAIKKRSEVVDGEGEGGKKKKKEKRRKKCVLEIIQTVSIQEQFNLNRGTELFEVPEEKTFSNLSSNNHYATQLSMPHVDVIQEIGVTVEPQMASNSTQMSPRLPFTRTKLEVKEHSVFDLLSLSNLEQFRSNHHQLIKTLMKNHRNIKVKEAYTTHKQVEEEMANYARFLKDHRYAISTHSKNINDEVILKAVNEKIDQVQLVLRNGQDLNFIERYAILQQFTVDIKNFYQKTLEQMRDIIEAKSEFCRQFVNKVYKYFNCHQLTIPIMEKQKNEYIEQLFHLYNCLHQLYLVSAEVPDLGDRAREIASVIAERMAKIDEIVTCGHNFY